MKSKIPTLAATAATSLFIATSANAAVIVWGAPSGVTAPTDISTNGTSLVAHNGGGSNTTVNGVNFTAADLLPSSGVSPGLLSGGTTGDAGFTTLLDEIDFGGGGGLVTLDIGTFTSGNTIEVQVFFTDQRPAQQDRVMRYGSSTGGLTVDLEANPDNTTGAPWGSFATGTFVADGIDPDLTLDAQGFGNAHFTAIQVRDLGVIPEPSASLLALLGCVGIAFRRRRS